MEAVFLETDLSLRLFSRKNFWILRRFLCQIVLAIDRFEDDRVFDMDLSPPEFDQDIPLQVILKHFH